ncbi:hypothetical protein PSY81_23315, partial [Shigella flexneri]|nr:hypothetical protein [Shigella flexneri]
AGGSLEPKEYFISFIAAKASYQDLVFARNDFLRLVGAPNESLILIIIYYMFKYSFGIKTTLLESLHSQNTHLRARFRQN